jgi:hypothetical protein
VKTFEGDNENLLINDIGPYQGTRPLAGNTTVEFEIKADGAWTVEIHLVESAEGPEFKGKGDDVSGFFDAPANGAWEVAHDGQSNFIVYLHCAGGSELIQNEIGLVSGSVRVTFPEGPCVWEVRADGKWSLAAR